MRHIVRDGIEEYWIVGPDEGEVILEFPDQQAAYTFLRRFARDPGQIRTLRSALREIDASESRLGDREVMQRLASAISRQRRRVAVQRRTSIGSSHAPSGFAEVDKTPPKPPEKTWIEIELLYPDGSPAAGHDYWIRLTDESEHEGKLDQNGRKYFGGLDPGTCIVKFPSDEVTDRGYFVKTRATPGGVGGEAAAAAAGLDALTDEPVEKTWIEVSLFDEAEQPMAGAAYQVTTADGGTKTGNLDEQGFARIEDIDKGTSMVSFPDLRFPALDDGERPEGESPETDDQGRTIIPYQRSFDVDTEKHHQFRLNRYVMSVSFIMESGSRAGDWPKYRLRSTDGSYEKELSPANDSVQNDDYLQLRYEFLLPDKSYTMHARSSDAVEEVVFQDLSYDDVMEKPRGFTDDLVDYGFDDHAQSAEGEAPPEPQADNEDPDNPPPGLDDPPDIEEMQANAGDAAAEA